MAQNTLAAATAPPASLGSEDLRQRSANLLSLMLLGIGFLATCLVPP